MRLSVVGLGKLGAPMAAMLASKGHTVLGVDADPAVVQAINLGRAPVAEPGLADLMLQSRARLSASTGCESVAATEATFIFVPTPSEPDGGFSLRQVMQAATAIGQALRRKDGYHLVVLSSTVMPGSTGGDVLAALEQASGRRCGGDLGLCYSPEFVALGSVIRDMLAPDFILIGESDQRSGEMLEQVYRTVCENHPPVMRMNFVNAEITKLAVNTFVTTKISYANMLAQICEGLPGADVDVVTSALGRDSRIGRKYLKGALGYGGPCFPRDNLAMARLARLHGVEAGLAEVTDRFNRAQAARLARLVMASLPEGGAVGILGLSYKPDTDVIEESQGLALAQQLLSQGVPVVVYDPVAMTGARRRLTGNVTFADSARDCAGRAHVVVIATPWPEFKDLSPRDLNRFFGPPTVLDCWRILDRQKFEAESRYVALGLGPQGVSEEALLQQAGR
jgi:UDPglucose 6-dehydrogenase